MKLIYLTIDRSRVSFQTKDSIHRPFIDISFLRKFPVRLNLNLSAGRSAKSIKKNSQAFLPPPPFSSTELRFFFFFFKRCFTIFTFPLPIFTFNYLSSRDLKTLDPLKKELFQKNKRRKLNASEKESFLKETKKRRREEEKKKEEQKKER